MNDQPIYAKSIESGITLLGHTQDVVASFRAIFGQADKPSRLGKCWQRFFKLEDFESFFSAGLAASLFHDWGKANDGFENNIRHKKKQPIRHEHLSALMMVADDVQRWRESGGDVDWSVVLAAVVSHHLKMTEREFAVDGRCETSRIELLTDRAEFGELLRWTANELRLPGSLPSFEQRVWSLREGEQNRLPVKPLRSKALKIIKSVGRECRKNSHSPFARMVMAVRSALIVADAAGSGLRRQGLSIEEWIAGQFDDRDLLSDETIWDQVIEPRVAQIEAGGREFDWNKFQIQCVAIPDRSLLIAPCGSGKTLAAWRKLAARCKQPVKRVLFLYPTRGTATEGFRDYVSWAPETKAALMHGKSGYDLIDMFENPEDQRHRKDYEQDPRLFALGFWSKQIFAATVDQFLAFMQHGYGPTCLLPVLADSMVVIDEIHSFDSFMWSALKDFLNHFDVPVLCMTASLSAKRTNELVEDCNMKLVEHEDEKLTQTAEAPRYNVTVLNEPDMVDIDARIAAAISKGRRVLWVVNQVKRAQEAAIRFAANFPDRELRVNAQTPLVCYHSRFRLDDRVEQHKQAVRLFQQKDHSALAITTQVCEMSLDLDADMIVTERAPVTSLIQRMGRCNRVKQPRDESGDVIIYNSEGDLPYDEVSLLGVDEFLAEVTSKPRVSQFDLEWALAKLETAEEIRTDSRFIRSGACAKTGEQSFRDIEAFTADAVLDRDVRAFNELYTNRRSKNRAEGYIVPIPAHLRFAENARNSTLPEHLFAAPGENYHPAIGFCNDPVRQPGGFIR